jgi:hypothetical protein
MNKILFSFFKRKRKKHTFIFRLTFNQVAKFILFQSSLCYCWQAAIDTQKPPEAISGNMTTGT